MVFFVSVGRNETENAVRYTYESASRFGHVVFHVDDEEVARWVRSIVKGADVVVVRGLGEGRAWFLEYVADTGEEGVMMDSHVYVFKRPECSDLCDFKRYDFGFDADGDPTSVINKAVHHYGQCNWDRKTAFFVFGCDYKPFSHNPLQYVHPVVAREVVNLYSKYGLRPIFPGYGSDMEQFYVSAWRLGFSGTCVDGITYAHRATVSNTGHPFWSERWKDREYFDKWFQANVCFLKLHVPVEKWVLPRSVGFDPSLCKYVDDRTARLINDEFRRGYYDYVKWAVDRGFIK